MFNFLFKFVLVFLIVFSIANSGESFPQFPLDENDKLYEYDILTLAQSWPQTSCWDINKKWPGSEVTCSPCKMPKAKSSWTLHGLWPSSLNGKHPFNCNNEIKFDPDLLSSALRAEMEEKWISFNLKMNNNVFWSHEWKKHGTCALNLESTNSLSKYFSKSIEMIDTYNVGKVLTRSGIVPGQEYKIDDILRVLGSSLGVNVYVKCSTNTVTKDQYLEEIHLCFDKSFKLTNCADDNSTNCSSKKQIVYPQILNSC